MLDKTTLPTADDLQKAFSGTRAHKIYEFGTLNYQGSISSFDKRWLVFTNRTTGDYISFKENQHWTDAITLLSKDGWRIVHVFTGNEIDIVWFQREVTVNG